MKKGIVIFDVDGVLLRSKIGGLKCLALFFVEKQKVAALVREYEKRKKKGPWGLEILASFFKGVSREKLKKLSNKLCRKNLMFGALKTVRGLKKQGYLIAAFSSNEMILMKELKHLLGLDFIGGNKLEFKNGVCAGRLAEKVNRYEKARRAKNLIKKLGFKKAQIFIVGDSITDLPMAKHGIFIAFNSKDPDVERVAQFIIKKPDLRELLDIIK